MRDWARWPSIYLRLPSSTFDVTTPIPRTLTDCSPKAMVRPPTLELLAEMRKNEIKVPALIVTAYSDVPNAVKAMKLGAIDFLQKPLRPDDLRSIVAEILKRHAGRDESPADTFGAHIVAAKRCLNLRAFGKARLHLVKALELNGKSAEAFNLAGVLAEVLEDYDKAKKYYGQAIKLNKNYEPAQQNMRRLFEVDHFGSSKEPVNLGEN